MRVHCLVNAVQGRKNQIETAQRQTLKNFLDAGDPVSLNACALAVVLDCRESGRRSQETE